MSLSLSGRCIAITTILEIINTLICKAFAKLLGPNRLSSRATGAQIYFLTLTIMNKLATVLRLRAKLGLPREICIVAFCNSDYIFVRFRHRHFSPFQFFVFSLGSFFFGRVKKCVCCYDGETMRGSIMRSNQWIHLLYHGWGREWKYSSGNC